MNTIKQYLKKAEKIRHDNIYNYNYVYWIKTPNGMRLDDELNHKYGNLRSGYVKWKEDNTEHIAGYGGTVSLREIRKRADETHIGYITEEKLSDNGWHEEIRSLADECFDDLCIELGVEDVESFKYFIYIDEYDYTSDPKEELINKLDVMVDVYNRYNDDEDYKKIVDKIKG